MDRGDIGAAFQIDKGFEEDLLAGRPAQVQLIVDGADSNTAVSCSDTARRLQGGFRPKLNPAGQRG